MDDQRIGFVIMQFGNEQLDTLHNDVYVRVLKEINLRPVRIDQDNQGELLKKEITENF